MTETATLRYNGTNIELPVVVGTQNEKAIDIRDLRAQSGLITLDDGYGNTGSCSSAITYVNGEKGILKYRGYLIESLATKASFIETAYLLIFGDLPTTSQLAEFRAMLTRHEFIHEDMRHHFDGFPPNAPPMAILSAMINAVGCFQPVFMQPEDDEYFLEPAARLMSKIRTIAAASYRKSIGAPIIYPRSKLRYTENLLHMMF
jgi:citrate synthase